MNNLVPSLIMLGASLLPAVIFIVRLKQFSAADLIHALLMAFICLAIGIVFAGAVITLTQMESQILIAMMVLIGSSAATTARLVWQARAN